MGEHSRLWRKDLCLEDFDISLIWEWDDEHDGHLPVMEHAPSVYEHEDLFIKATFQSPNGLLFDGFLVGAPFFHAFFIFLDDQVFGFNVGLRSHTLLQHERLCKYMNREMFPLFPLLYKSDVVLKEIGRVEGVLDWN